MAPQQGRKDRPGARDVAGGRALSSVPWAPSIPSTRESRHHSACLLPTRRQEDQEFILGYIRQASLGYMRPGLIKQRARAGKMTQWWTALAALVKNQSSVLRAYTRKLKTASNFSSKGLAAMWPLGPTGTCAKEHTCTCTHVNAHMYMHTGTCTQK